MNKNIDLTKILKDCPKGWKLYSTTLGYVTFQEVDNNDVIYPIIVRCKQGVIENFTTNGKISIDYEGECILFPSKDQRDWSKFTAPWYKKDKFDPNTLQPFDRVLIRNYCNLEWSCDFFSYIGQEDEFPYVCVGSEWTYCIPYNDETKHLVGTIDEAPENYRYWED